MATVTSFMTSVSDVEQFVRTPRKRVGIVGHSSDKKVPARPKQQAVSMNELTTAERHEFADLLEAEIARI